ncbi:MAG TPA: SIMPL domain-containing protein [Flavisolibacter sp.]|nr:SIMPL domain-containing protein [Flavisolibacter sp.]
MKKSILFIFIFISFYAIGQTEKTLNQKPFIEVVGTATKEIAPDKIFISIVLSDKVVSNENYTIQLQEDKLKNALYKLNIGLDNLVLTDAASEISRVKKRETGFKVTKTFTLQVASSEEVSKVFKELYVLNIKEGSIVKTEYSKIDSLRKEVRIAAIKAAKEKAEYLLSAIGEQVDKPLEIREQEDIPFYKESLANTTLNVHLNGQNNNSSEINFEKMTIKFLYYIKYAIK